MALASGFTAIEQRKEVAEIFEGKLSQKYITYYARKNRPSKTSKLLDKMKILLFLLFMFIVTKRRFWNI